MKNWIEKIDYDQCHVVAKKNGFEIEIDKAQSGKGYECIGCHREMQAVLFAPPHLSYFRHHPSNVEKHLKCQWSDETYRHGIAKMLLTSLRRIKVPAVKKFPPPGINGDPLVIRKKRWISAPRAESELYFFENDQGEIHWQRHIPDGAKCHHIIKPDVIFFDKNDQPILFIELVATNKVSDEKHVKINRIGVDTIQVIVPKRPSAEIEKSFAFTKQTKWIFNHEEQQTKYIPLSSGDNLTLSKIDREQRKLYEESLSCWTTEIGDLVRSIDKCVSSKQYRDIEQFLRDEISRVGGLIYKASVNLRHREEQLEGEIQSEFSGEESDLDKEEENLRTSLYGIEREKIDNRSKEIDLEKRYRTKVEELTREEKEFNDSMAEEESILLERIGDLGASPREGGKSVEQQEAEIDRGIEEGERRIRHIESEISRISNPSAIENDPIIIRIDSDKRTEEEGVENVQRFIDGLPGEFESKRKRSEQRDSDLRRELEERISSQGRELDRRLKNQDYAGAGELSERISGLLSIRRQLDIVLEEQGRHKRIRSAYKTIKQGTYKTWPNFGRLSKTNG